MVILHQENLKSNIRFTTSDALKSLLEIIVMPYSALRNLIDFVAIKLHPELKEVHKLIGEFQSLPKVGSVRAIRNKKGNSRKVVFEILADVSPSERIDLLTNAINLSSETEWKLDALTKSRDWELQIKILKKFSGDKKSQAVILSNDRPKYLSPAS